MFRVPQILNLLERSLRKKTRRAKLERKGLVFFPKCVGDWELPVVINVGAVSQILYCICAPANIQTQQCEDNLWIEC